MSDDAGDLVFVRRVDAAPEAVFYAFSTAQGWRDWLCDAARFEAKTGGTYQLSWNKGWYAVGVVEELKRPETLLLRWQGMGDHLPSKLSIQLAAVDGGTEVTLRHLGIGARGDSPEAREAIQRGWELGLENLVSIFTGGEDLRITRRPMLGIMLNDFDAKVAKELGVPVAEGVRVDRPIEGMGAERAGLKPNDVVVDMAEKAIRGFGDIGVALQGRRAGDVVAVAFYRGNTRHEVAMELSKRPLETFPLDPGAIGGKVRESNAVISKELREFFNSVTEAEADFIPGPDQWSAKEALAHLIGSEQSNQTWIVDLINDSEPEAPENPTNVRARLRMFLRTTPTIPRLLDRLDQSFEETACLLEGAERLESRKGVLWRLGQALLQLPFEHPRMHMEQMRAAIESARRGP